MPRTQRLRFSTAGFGGRHCSSSPRRMRERGGFTLEQKAAQRPGRRKRTPPRRSPTRPPPAEPDGPAAPGRAGIKNPRVLDAFRTVPRHRFLPPETRRQAYDDESIPIGEGQTITPPYDVAFMTEVLEPKPTDKVYEVGTGSGYQAAILSRLVKDVYSVEIHEPLGKRATAGPSRNSATRTSTPGSATATPAGPRPPRSTRSSSPAPRRASRQPLVEQLKEGGRMVIPLGDRFNQVVHLMTKKDGKLTDTRAPADPVRADDRARPSGGRRKEGEAARGNSRDAGRALPSWPHPLSSSFAAPARYTNAQHLQSAEPEIERPAPPAARRFRDRRERRRRSRRLVQPAATPRSIAEGGVVGPHFSGSRAPSRAARRG